MAHFIAKCSFSTFEYCVPLSNSFWLKKTTGFLSPFSSCRRTEPFKTNSLSICLQDEWFVKVWEEWMIADYFFKVFGCSITFFCATHCVGGGTFSQVIQHCCSFCEMGNAFPVPTHQTIKTGSGKDWMSSTFPTWGLIFPNPVTNPKYSTSLCATAHLWGLMVNPADGHMLLPGLAVHHHIIQRCCRELRHISQDMIHLLLKFYWCPL